jgi:hypothetical protein
MRRLIALVLGAAIGGAVVFGSFYYHIVRTDKTWLIVPKQRLDWRDAYVDIRGWSHREWSNHRDLSNNLIVMGRGDLVARSVADQLFRGLFDSFREPSSSGRGSNSSPSK